jgi:hypothetical protein
VDVRVLASDSEKGLYDCDTYSSVNEQSGVLPGQFYEEISTMGTLVAKRMVMLRVQVEMMTIMEARAIATKRKGSNPSLSVSSLSMMARRRNMTGEVLLY